MVASKPRGGKLSPMVGGGSERTYIFLGGQGEGKPSPDLGERMGFEDCRLGIYTPCGHAGLGGYGGLLSSRGGHDLDPDRNCWTVSTAGDVILEGDDGGDDERCKCPQKRLKRTSYGNKLAHVNVPCIYMYLYYMQHMYLYLNICDIYSMYIDLRCNICKEAPRSVKFLSSGLLQI